MEKFLFKTITYSLPFIFLLVSINYLLDPAKLFNSEYIKSMISILDQGYYVTNITNYNERTFQKSMISAKSTLNVLKATPWGPKGPPWKNGAPSDVPWVLQGFTWRLLWAQGVLSCRRDACFPCLPPA